MCGVGEVRVLHTHLPVRYNGRDALLLLLGLRAAQLGTVRPSPQPHRPTESTGESKQASDRSHLARPELTAGDPWVSGRYLITQRPSSQGLNAHGPDAAFSLPFDWHAATANHLSRNRCGMPVEFINLAHLEAEMDLEEGATGFREVIQEVDIEMGGSRARSEAGGGEGARVHPRVSEGATLPSTPPRTSAEAARAGFGSDATPRREATGVAAGEEATEAAPCYTWLLAEQQCMGAFGPGSPSQAPVQGGASGRQVGGSLHGPRVRALLSVDDRQKSV